MRLLLAFFLALASSPASAQSGGLIDFPQGANASRDGFFAGIVTTNELERFGQTWIAGGPLQSTVTQRAERGRELKAIVLIQDCRAGADGKCNVTARFTYLRPDGTVYGTVDDDDLWTDGPRGGIVVTIGPGLVVDPPDPMGTWVLRAEVRDNVRGTILTVSTPIIVDTPPAAAN